MEVAMTFLKIGLAAPDWGGQRREGVKGNGRGGLEMFSHLYLRLHLVLYFLSVTQRMGWRIREDVFHHCCWWDLPPPNGPIPDQLHF